MSTCCCLNRVPRRAARFGGCGRVGPFRGWVVPLGLWKRDVGLLLGLTTPGGLSQVSIQGGVVFRVSSTGFVARVFAAEMRRSVGRSRGFRRATSFRLDAAAGHRFVLGRLFLPRLRVADRERRGSSGRRNLRPGKRRSPRLRDSSRGDAKSAIFGRQPVPGSPFRARPLQQAKHKAADGEDQGDDESQPEAFHVGPEGVRGEPGSLVRNPKDVLRRRVLRESRRLGNNGGRRVLGRHEVLLSSHDNGVFFLLSAPRRSFQGVSSPPTEQRRAPLRTTRQSFFPPGVLKRKSSASALVRRESSLVVSSLARSREKSRLW